jgi:LacI family transcriptional regulator
LPDFGVTKSKVTISDIARAAGVSPSTVSRVLNERESTIAISVQTRERVLAAATSLDYRPNLAARSLVSGRSQAVAVLVHDISDPYFSEIVRGIEDVASTRQYMVLVSSTDRDPVREREYLLRMVSFPTDGVILAAGGFEIERDPNQVRDLVESGAAIVGIARHQLPISTIDIGNQDGSRRVVEYLIGLGHRRIAFLAGPAVLTTANDRLTGYREALDAAGLLANELILPGDFTREAGLRAAAYLSEQHPATTAVIAANDKMAIGCLTGFREAGVAVPDAMSVVGFGDIPAASDSDPPLTTVTVPLREVGRLAMDHIFRQIDGVAVTPPWIPTTLAIRHSTAPPGKRTDLTTSPISRQASG